MKSDRFLLLASLILGSTLMAGPLALADDKKDDSKDSSKGDSTQTAPDHKRGKEELIDRFKHMAEQLNLTDEQKEKIKPIFKEEAGKLKELQGDDKLSRKEKVHKLRDVQEKISAKLKDVLTPEQLEKWEKLKDERGKKGRKNAA